MTIIDTDNYAASGIETLFFPGGEPHVKVPEFAGPVTLYARLRTWADVGFAVLVMDALSRQKGVTTKVAFIPYLPGARQDRSDGSAGMTLAVIRRLLAFGTWECLAFDPHSDAAFIEGPLVGAFMPMDLSLKPDPAVVGVIAPDAGAFMRAKQYRDRFHPTASLIECSKTRDPHTGCLSNYHMERLTRPGRYVVVDDICDGGGTFNLLATAFNSDPLAAQCTLELFVSHGIFSRGVDMLSARYERITTTDSWCRHPSEGRLRVIPLRPLIEGESGARLHHTV